jgi:cobalamin biosynthesis protein CobD/CbiB
VNGGTVNFSVTFPLATPYTASAPVVNGLASASFIVPAGDFLAVPGSYPIAAAYVPSGNLEASSDTTKQLTISKIPLVIAWATPAPIANGTPLEFGQLNATVSPGAAYATCAYTPQLGTILAGPGTFTLSVTCTPAIGSEYTAATATVSIQVTTMTALTVTWANPAPIVNGTPLGAAQLNAVASPSAALATCVYTPALGKVLSGPGAYSLSVTCTPASSEQSSYSATTATVSLLVTAPLTIAWANPAPIANGTPLISQLNAIASPGTAYATCAYNPPLGTVLPGPGMYTLSVTCTPNILEQSIYTAATATVSITVTPQVAKIPLTITWATPAPIGSGTPLGSDQLNATASPSAASATCVYTPPSGTILAGPGAHTLSVTCTPASSELATYTAATATVSMQVLSVTRTTPTIVWATPAAIPAGTALSVTQLNATAVTGAPLSFTVPGIFVYSPPAGTVPPAGNNEALSVTFTPTDTTSYQTATAKVYINVVSAAVAVSVETVILPFIPSGGVSQLPIFTANVTNASITGGVSFTALGTTSQATVANGVARMDAVVPAGTPAGVYPIVANYSDPLNPKSPS